MRRSGLEWLFRLAQEPRRLFKRYTGDLWVFSWRLLVQWWKLRMERRSASKAWNQQDPPNALEGLVQQENDSVVISCPERLDLETVRGLPDLTNIWRDPNPESGCARRHLLLDMATVDFIDSTGIGLLLRLHKQAQANHRRLVLLAPTAAVQRALSVLRLANFFLSARDASTARHLIRHLEHEPAVPNPHSGSRTHEPLSWQGEITAVNAVEVWNRTQKQLAGVAPPNPWKVDLSAVRFIDSSGAWSDAAPEKICAGTEPASVVSRALSAGAQCPSALATGKASTGLS
jgi:anti-anti-sigma factor